MRMQMQILLAFRRVHYHLLQIEFFFYRKLSIIVFVYLFSYFLFFQLSTLLSNLVVADSSIYKDKEIER